MVSNVNSRHFSVDYFFNFFVIIANSYLQRVEKSGHTSKSPPPHFYSPVLGSNLAMKFMFETIYYKTVPSNEPTFLVSDS